MSKLMFKPDGGFHHFPDGEVAELMKSGWVDGEPIMKAAVEAKRATKRAETAPIAEQAGPIATPTPDKAKHPPGRPRNVVPSILNDGEI